MKYLNFATKFTINFFATIVIGVLFFINLDHFAIAFIMMMLVLYTAEYSEKKLTNW